MDAAPESLHIFVFQNCIESLLTILPLQRVGRVLLHELRHQAGREQRGQHQPLCRGPTFKSQGAKILAALKIKC